MAYAIPTCWLNLIEALNDDEWKKKLAKQFEEKYFKDLEMFLQNESAGGYEIYPPRELIFSALNLTPLEKVKVVIIGQDPYHTKGKAMGLAFSVPVGITTPPSLRNMFGELKREFHVFFEIPNHGCLVDWAYQGVLLMNSTLTVRAGEAKSHLKFGWQRFTDAIIKAVSENCNHVVFILMGAVANKKYDLIDLRKHTIIKTGHPSPLAQIKLKNQPDPVSDPELSLIPFIGSNCFFNCNVALENKGQTPVNWNLFQFKII